MPITSLRQIKEGPRDRILEIHDKTGMVMEMPTQVSGYTQLYALLERLAKRFQRNG